METQTCPKCGFAREPKALDCPVCGVVYAKFERAAASRPAPARPAELDSPFASGSSPYAAPPPLPPVNPYAAPQANLALGPPPVPAAVQGVWRSGDKLVVCKGYPLPGRCVVCNQETSFRWHKTFSWVPGWVHILVFWLLIYLIVYLSVRKQADLAVPLCREHDDKRKRDTTLSWVLCLVGVVMMFGCIAASESLVGLILLTAFGTIIAGVVLSVKGSVVRPVKIDNTYVWLKKVNPEYLAALPEAMMGI